MSPVAEFELSQSGCVYASVRSLFEGGITFKIVFSFETREGAAACERSLLADDGMSHHIHVARVGAMVTVEG